MATSTQTQTNSPISGDHRSKLARRLGLIAWGGLWIGGLYLAHEILDLMAPAGIGLTGGIGWLGGQTLVLAMLVLGLVSVTPGLPQLRWRGALSLTLWALLIVIGHHFSHQELHTIRESFEDMRTWLGPQGLLICVLVYGLLLAIPFVPGVEVGLVLMAAFGTVGVVMVYLGTVFGLCLAFCVGRFLPTHRVKGWVSALGLDANSNPTTMLWRNRAARLGGPLATLSRHRAITLAVAFNLPGNTVLGGGGGISLICGAARWLSWPRFIITVILATAPVPLLVGFGLIQLGGL